MIDIELLKAAAAPRMGDLLERLGAKVRGSAERGRASCPVHEGDGFNTQYGNGFATCYSACGIKARDPIALVMDSQGLGFSEACEWLGALVGHTVTEARALRVRAPRLTPSARREGRDTARLWSAFAARDPEGEAYLRGRRLGAEIPDLVRFNTGASGDPWVDARGVQGFRVAFAARDASGTVRSLSFRWSRPDPPPEDFGKAPSLAGCTTSGLAVCRPEIRLLAEGDPEFERDEVIVLEGGPDALAATRIYDEAAMERACAPAWALGAIGTGAGPTMVRSFAPVLGGRTVLIGFDTDAPGEAAVASVADAARAAGARRVLRVRPPGKDIAAVLEAA